MSSAWPAIVTVVGAGAVIARRTRRTDTPTAQPMDLVKAGQLFGLAAEWLRGNNPDAAWSLLQIIPAAAWQFARYDVVEASDEPRIAAMSERMTAATFFNTPREVPDHVDRLIQIETLNAVAVAIRNRTRPGR